MTTLRRGPAALGAALVPGTAGLGCGGDSGDTEPAADAETTSEVTIDNFEFMPADFSVEAGEEVTVTNVDTAAHTLSADGDGDFDTGAIQADGDEGTITIDEPGSYPFVCEFHPTMAGTVTVAE